MAYIEKVVSEPADASRLCSRTAEKIPNLMRLKQTLILRRRKFVHSKLNSVASAWGYCEIFKWFFFHDLGFGGRALFLYILLRWIDWIPEILLPKLYLNIIIIKVLGKEEKYARSFWRLPKVSNIDQRAPDFRHPETSEHTVDIQTYL